MYKLMFNERDGLYYVLNMGTTPILVEYTNPHIKNAIKECSRLNGEAEAELNPTPHQTYKDIQKLGTRLAALEGKQSEMDDIGLINRVFGIYKELDALKAKQADKDKRNQEVNVYNEKIMREWDDIRYSAKQFTKTIAKFNDRLQKIESVLKYHDIKPDPRKDADKPAAMPVVEEIYTTNFPNDRIGFHTPDISMALIDVCHRLNANEARKNILRNLKAKAFMSVIDYEGFEKIVAAIDAYEDGK